MTHKRYELIDLYETGCDEGGDGIMTELTCILCGKSFDPGTDADGVPNGIGFTTNSGNTYNLCKECVSHRYEESVKLLEDKEESE